MASLAIQGNSSTFITLNHSTREGLMRPKISRYFARLIIGFFTGKVFRALNLPENFNPRRTLSSTKARSPPGVNPVAVLDHDRNVRLDHARVVRASGDGLRLSRHSGLSCRSSQRNDCVKPSIACLAPQ